MRTMTYKNSTKSNNKENTNFNQLYFSGSVDPFFDHSPNHRVIVEIY